MADFVKAPPLGATRPGVRMQQWSETGKTGVLGTLSSLLGGGQWPVQSVGYLVMNQMQGQDCLLRDVSPLILLSLQTFEVEGGPPTCKGAK